MKRLALIAALVALLGIAGWAAEAYAGGCTTTCYRTFNGGQTCNTYCY